MSEDEDEKQEDKETDSDASDSIENDIDIEKLYSNDQSEDMEKEEEIKNIEEQILGYNKALISPLMEFNEVLKRIDPIKNIQELLVEVIQPEWVHRSQIKDAYENNNKEVVIILLNVFFETVNERAIKDKLKEINKGNEKSAGFGFVEEISHSHKLQLGRILGTIDEDMYQVMNHIRKARNRFVHNLDNYKPSEAKKIIEDARLKDAIEIYERTLKISDEESMLNKDE